MRGTKLTPLRLSVLRALWSANEPVGAYDLSDRVGIEAGGRRMAANSIYRVLLLFTELGLVRRVESRQAYVVARDGDPGSDMFFLCDGCGAVTAIDQPQLAALLTSQASALGFRPHHQVVEVAGQCRTCAESQSIKEQT
nr:Fur family transcriptional regulator [Polymorphobacter multimanifer]